MYCTVCKSKDMEVRFHDLHSIEIQRNGGRHSGLVSCIKRGPDSELLYIVEVMG